MTSPAHESLPTLPFKEKLIIIGRSLLLVVVIYTVIDLYEPVKKLLSGQGITWKETVSHLEVLEKWPIVAIITALMANSSIKKKTKALQEPQTQPQETTGQGREGK
ncbi:hypothetical protein TH61_09090 [Rufibacter sp. DG15C]|uniref:hypothetical protein n=1 Tax=Rufibacter sp. DG15C TaxID=1379909 RepID=UPI00078C9206|nr:hypothetical protein [Rufibacter sp. DG15C]AMM51294.1 hypothetical protein TH61_09090 [Rufibacter sp. DG15C]